MTSKHGTETTPTLALNTKLEQDFVAPLTAVRSALEILRDHSDLTSPERDRFVSTALSACSRLEDGIEQLAAAVYNAARRGDQPTTDQVPDEVHGEYKSRIKFLNEQECVEVDFSEIEFSSSRQVNDFYDMLEKLISATERKWYIVVNYRNVSVWPEAWVAFAHRGKKINVSYSLGTARYIENSAGSLEPKKPSDSDPDMFDSRKAALDHIDSLRHAGQG